MTAPVEVSELEELLEEEIPCHECGKPAQLRSYGHKPVDCNLPQPGPYYKCLPCWQTWLGDVLSDLRWGKFKCIECGRKFDSVESFSDYRPF